MNAESDVEAMVDLRDAIRNRHQARIEVDEARDRLAAAKADLRAALDAESSLVAALEVIEREILDGMSSLPLWRGGGM